MQTVAEDNDGYLPFIPVSAIGSVPSPIPRIDPSSVPSPVPHLALNSVPTLTTFGTNLSHSVSSNTHRFNLNYDWISGADLGTDLGFGLDFSPDLGVYSYSCTKY